MAQKLDETFITRNKNVLIEEITENINNINILLEAATKTGHIENPASELSMTKNIVIAMAQNVGSLTSCFNQYLIFEKGQIPENKIIGFQSLLSTEKDK